MFKIYLLILLGVLFSGGSAGASEQKSQIREALQHYLQGSSYNYTQRLEKAFHIESELFLDDKEQNLWVVPSEEYISWFKRKAPGTFNFRIGEILSIDQFGNTASAKAEIIMPKLKKRFVDYFILKRVDNNWQIVSKAATSEVSNRTGERILFILSNADFHGNADIPAGSSFSEIVNAYATFIAAGFTVDFMSPDGGQIPLAYINTSEPIHKQYLYNADFMYKLANANSPAQVTPADYRAVYYVGGSNAMYNVPEDKHIQQIVMEIYEQHNGVIAAVCHGTAGIVNLRTQQGDFLVKGKSISGYPESFENKQADYFKQFPFLIQETIEQRGGKFRVGKRNHSHIEIDGRLVTGQNHLSSADVANAVVAQLSKQKQM